jgi:hypothetical protein
MTAIDVAKISGLSQKELYEILDTLMKEQ